MLISMVLEFFPDYSEIKINVFRNMAIDMVRNYIGDSSLTDDYIETEYINALFLLIHNAIRYEQMKGIKVLHQGNKRIEYGQTTYNAYGLLDLTDEVKALLPVPVVNLI